jgi:hypothetical protein
MIRTISIFVFISTFNFAFSQVANNKISQRFTLELDTNPIASTTTNSSVEWQCINKALTNKCLVYHNDQWFSFQVENAGDYYLNLSGQQCKKLKGIQVIVIEGNPCEIKSYNILQCIPKVSQEDTFVELKSIKANTLYLLNIDGFLGDFCEFEIQLATHPNGLPLLLNRSDTSATSLSISDRKILLTWKLTPDLLQSIETFRVGRKKNKGVKSKWTTVDAKSNAYGQLLREYSLTDTLTEQGDYTFTVLGLTKETGYPIFINEKKISYWEKGKASSSQGYIYFTPAIKKAASLQIVVLDEYTDAVVHYLTINYDPKKNKSVAFPVSLLMDADVKSCIIQIKNQKTLEIQKLFYKLDEKGAFQLYTKDN